MLNISELGYYEVCYLQTSSHCDIIFTETLALYIKKFLFLIQKIENVYMIILDIDISYSFL